MSQTDSNSIGDILAGLTQMAGSVDKLMETLDKSTTPEILDQMPLDKRQEIEALKSQAKFEGGKIKPEADKAMDAATELLRKFGM